MTPQRAWWRVKSPASRLFTQPFILAQIKENIKAPRHWPLWGEFSGDLWIPRTKRPVTGKMFPFDDVNMGPWWHLEGVVLRSHNSKSVLLHYADFDYIFRKVLHHVHEIIDFIWACEYHCFYWPDIYIFHHFIVQKDFLIHQIERLWYLWNDLESYMINESRLDIGKRDSLGYLQDYSTTSDVNIMPVNTRYRYITIHWFVWNIMYKRNRSKNISHYVTLVNQLSKIRFTKGGLR